MNNNAEFYAMIRERLAAARALMDAATVLIKEGENTQAGWLLGLATAQHDAMLEDMRRMNAERLP